MDSEGEVGGERKLGSGGVWIFRTVKRKAGSQGAKTYEKEEKRWQR